MVKAIFYASAIYIGLGLSSSYLVLADPIEIAQNSKKFEIAIKNRKVIGKNIYRAKHGEIIQLHWVTDEKVKLHLHGYDIEITVLPGQPKVMVLNAKATGRFPITSHGFGDNVGHSNKHAALFYLEVYPR